MPGSGSLEWDPSRCTAVTAPPHGTEYGPPASHTGGRLLDGQVIVIETWQLDVSPGASCTRTVAVQLVVTPGGVSRLKVGVGFNGLLNDAPGHVDVQK